MLKVGNSVLEVKKQNEQKNPFIPKWDPSFWIDEEALEILAYSIAENKNCMMVGPTGCGKSTLVKNFASLLNQPARRINFNRDTRASDVIGEKTLDEDRKIKFIDGVFTQCARNGWWVLLDELDAAPPGVLMRMQSALEEERQLVLTENDAEEVEIHPDFRIISTSNTKGQGDSCGQYAGTHVVNVSTLNRFAVVVEMNFPPRDKEVEIITTKSKVELPIAKKMVEVARLVRNGFYIEECSFIFSTRNLVELSKLFVKVKDVKKAFKFTCLNKACTADAKYISQIVNRVF